MKKSILPSSFAFSLAGLFMLTPSVRAESTAQASAPIPLCELGARVGAQYEGAGLTVEATPDGARLHCVFQKLEGQITSEGLWLVSTVAAQTEEKLHVVASAVGREGGLSALPQQGNVTVVDQRARFARPSLTEEYSVSVDGVRQDLVVTERPTGTGPLRIELSVSGAKAEALANGVRLALAGSGRKLAYNRLRVVDAAGEELAARMEAEGVRPEICPGRD